MVSVRHVSPNSVNTLLLSDHVLVEVRTTTGLPVPGVLCKLTFSDKRVEEGRTDNRGIFMAPHDLDEVGDVTIEFPRLGGAVWRPADPGGPG